MPGGKASAAPNAVRSGSTLVRAMVRVLALIGLVLFAAFFGVVALGVTGAIEMTSEGAADDPSPSVAALMGAARPGELVHGVGAVATFGFGATALIALAARPASSGAAYQVLAVNGALLASLPLVGNPDNYGGQAGAIDPVFLVVAAPSLAAGVLARPWRTNADGPRPRLQFLWIALVAAFPAAWYGVDQALIQRSTYPPAADPHHNAHWQVMAIFVFAVVLMVASGAPTSSGTRSRVGLAAAGAVVFGVASLLAPRAASAAPLAWSLAALVWGVVTIALVLAEGGRGHSAAAPEGGTSLAR